MIELRHDALVFRFPQVHSDALLEVDFQRTLRIPDDGSDYPLPPGFGRFPVRHVEDYVAKLPETWRKHGGVLLPMYQSEAMWLSFSSPTGYPFAVKVAAGKINAATGEPWRPGLHPDPQDYLAVPVQPWLDGYVVEKGFIRQFVAMPLGSGYSAEEQITGEADHGGLQIGVYPLRAEKWEALKRARQNDAAIFRCAMPCAEAAVAGMDMGLAPGGRMRQEIYHDRFTPEDYDQSVSGRCFVHIANSLVWRSITGHEPPTTPPTASEYAQAGLPWFEYYSDQPAISGTSLLGKLKSIVQLGTEKGHVPLPENESVSTGRVLELKDWT
jgi:hypothetical protein